MNPDLEVSPSEVTKLNLTCKYHKLFFFPDGISLSFPKIIETGSPFKIIANWLINHTSL